VMGEGQTRLLLADHQHPFLDVPDSEILGLPC
jgi:hypothetical protein